MSITVDPGYILRKDNDTLEIDLTDKSHFNSARVKWKGKNTTVNLAKNNNVSYPPTNQTTYPSVYAGYAFTSHTVYANVTVTNISGHSTNVAGFVYDAEGTHQYGYYSLAAGASKLISMNVGTQSSYYSGQTVLVAGASNPIGEITVTAAYLSVTTNCTADTLTVNPSISVGGYTYSHVGTLDVDVESSWVNIPSGIIVDQNNIITFNFDDYSEGYAEIEYIYEPRLPLNTITSPTNGKRISDTEIDFVFTLDEDTDNSATKYHAKIRLDDFSTMLSPITYESKTSQTGWTYWDGDSWEPFPSGGVDPDTIVRYTKTLSLGTLYWDVSSWDDYGYGYVGTPYKFKITINVVGPYILNIGGDIYTENYKAFELNVIETSNGEIGTILATINNADGSADVEIDYGNSVTVAFRDDDGNQEEFMGVVREKIPNGFNLTIVAILGDGILAERIVKEDFIKQDVGITAKAIIDTYCQPLTSDNIDIATGFEAPIPADGKKALAIFELIRKNYGLFYYVDIDWDTHLYSSDDIVEEPNIEVRYGDGTV